MIIVQKQNGSFVEIAPGSTITSGEVRYPWQVAELWTGEALKAIGVYRAVLAAIPDGKVVTGYSFTQSGDVVTQVLQLANGPAKTRLYKRTIFERGSAEENEAFRAFLDQANATDWGIYDSISHIDHTDPQFATLRMGMAQALMQSIGSTETAALARIDTILAPEF